MQALKDTKRSSKKDAAQDCKKPIECKQFFHYCFINYIKMTFVLLLHVFYFVPCSLFHNSIKKLQ